MTYLERSSNIQHESMMHDKDYGAQHVQGFNGPGYLNINAIWMDNRDLKDDKVFKHTKYYDVYRKDELEYCIPVAHRVLAAEAKTYDDEYKIVQYSYTEAEYTFTDGKYIAVCIGLRDVAVKFDADFVMEMATAINKGGLVRGWKPSVRYVEYGIDGEEIGEIVL